MSDCVNQDLVLSEVAKYFVYWIHLKTQVDPYVDGYIGVTNYLQRRWKRHKRHVQRIESKRNGYPLYVAFRQYGLNRFSFDVIATNLDKWSAYNMEYALRPHKRIGYNLEPGGFMKSCLLCCSISPLRNLETHSKMISEHIQGRRGKPLGAD